MKISVYVLVATTAFMVTCALAVPTNMHDLDRRGVSVDCCGFLFSFKPVKLRTTGPSPSNLQAMKDVYESSLILKTQAAKLVEQLGMDPMVNRDQFMLARNVHFAASGYNRDADSAIRAIRDAQERHQDAERAISIADESDANVARLKKSKIGLANLPELARLKKISKADRAEANELIKEANDAETIAMDCSARVYASGIGLYRVLDTYRHRYVRH